MSVIGSIELQILADMARFRRDMGEAIKVTQSAAKSMQDTLGRIGAGLSVGAIVLWTKSVIDAAGAAVDMSQKLGMTVEDLQAHALAFRQAGVDQEQFKAGMVQMSKSVIDNAGAYKALGVATEDASGRTRATQDIMLELADTFKALPDGILKTKLATELFGKAGADMIPALNQGGAALRQAAADAQAMGAVMSTEAAKAADDFGDALDVLKAKAQAATLNGLSEMLPVLSEVAKQFALTGKEANKAGADAGFWQEAFATATEAVGVLVLNTVYVFRTMAGEIGAILRGLKAMATGNFAEAARISDEWTARAAAMRSEVDQQSAAILGARDKHRQAAEAMQAGAAAASESAGENAKLARQAQAAAVAQAKAALGAKEAEAANKRAAEEAKRLAEHQRQLQQAGQHLVQQMEDELAARRMATAMGRELTDGEKEYLKIAIQVRDGKVKMTDAELRRAWAAGQALDAISAQKKAEEDLAKAMAAVAQHATRLEGDEGRRTEALRESVIALREENEHLQMGDAAFDRRQAKLQRDEAAELEWQAAMQGGNFQLTEQARLLRERAGLMEDGVALREAKAVAAEWKKTTDQVNDAMTDALMRAFERGESAWVAFRNSLINSAKTLILRPMVEFALSPVSNQVGGWLQLFRAAAGAIGTSGGDGSAGSIGAADEVYQGSGKSTGDGATSGGKLSVTGSGSGKAGTLSMPARTAAPAPSRGSVTLTQHVTVNVDASADQARLAGIARDAVVRGNQEFAKELKAQGVLA